MLIHFHWNCGKKQLHVFFIIILIDPRLFGWPTRQQKSLENITNLRTLHKQYAFTGEKTCVGSPIKAINEDSS